MKNFVAIALISVVFCLNALAQTDTTRRPRVAPTPTPPVITGDPYSTRPNGGPPVLMGGKNSGNATPTPTPDDGIIKVETNLVTMPVSVLDRDGRFISGLQQQDFKIFENGVEQKVGYFQSVEQPFSVILLLDVSPSTSVRIEEIQDAAITFIDKLRPNDRVMVIAFDEHVHVLSPFTNDRYELRDAIRQAQFGDGTSLYEAVDYVINQEMRQVRGRKAVVLFTDGVDTTSRRANYQNTINEAEEVDSLFYTVWYDTSQDGRGGGGGGYGRHGGYGGRQNNPCGGGVLAAILCGGNVNMGRGGNGQSASQYAVGRKYLESLATVSGGRNFEAETMFNADAAFSGIAEELRRQYSLGYYPETVGKIGERKQIKVRVMRPDIVVRAKTSYIVGQTDRNLAGK